LSLWFWSIGLTSGCGNPYRSRLSHRTVPHPTTSQEQSVWLKVTSPISNIVRVVLNFLTAHDDDGERLVSTNIVGVAALKNLVR
jgi:hypothetical protein